MQFYLNINQMKASEWGLNLAQSAMFAFLYELPAWADSITLGEKVYYKCSKQKLVDELPIITDKPDTAYRICKVLEEKYLVEKVILQKIIYFRVTGKGQEWNRSEESPTIGNKSDDGKKVRSAETSPHQVGNKSDQKSEKSPTDHINQDQINHINNLFEELWTAFPKDLGSKGSKQNALKNFKKLKPQEALFQRMKQAVTNQTNQKRLFKSNGQFAEPFQHVERWIKNRRWEDEIPELPGGQNHGSTSQSSNDSLLGDRNDTTWLTGGGVHSK